MKSERSMRYPVVIHHDDGTAYGVTVPDIPGCFSAGETVDEALENTQVAIAGHLELLAEDGQVAPVATDITAHQGNPDYADGIWGYVEVDITSFLGKTEKVNVTPVKPKKSPLDVESVDLSLSAADIVSVVNEGRGRNCGF